MFGDDVFGYDTDGDGFIDTPDSGSIFGYDFDGDGDIDWEDDFIGLALYEQTQKHSMFGYDFDGNRDVDWEDDFIGAMAYEQAQEQRSYQDPRRQRSASASGSGTRWSGKSGPPPKTDMHADRPAKRRRFSVGGMTQRQFVIIIVLGLAVMLEFYAIGAAILRTMTRAPTPFR